MVSPAEHVFVPHAFAPGAAGLAHLGPAAPPLISPWFSLFVYEALGAGPPTLLLRRGRRLRALPPYLASHASLRLVPWEGEPAVVRGGAALAAAN